MDTDEIWKWIPGYEGLYKVSNIGRVKSYHINRFGSPLVLKCTKDKNGYHRVALTKDHQTSKFFVHRLILLTFIGDPPSDKHQGSHLNDIPWDNKLTNLKWATPLENIENRDRLSAPYSKKWKFRKKHGV